MSPVMSLGCSCCDNVVALVVERPQEWQQADGTCRLVGGCVYFPGRLMALMAQTRKAMQVHEGGRLRMVRYLPRSL